MTNPHYNHTSGVPSQQSRGVSSSIRAEFDLVGAGFDSVVSAIAQVNRQTPLAWVIHEPSVTDYTASAGQFVIMTCVTAGIVRLPANPQTGDIVRVKFMNMLTTNKVSGNGKPLMRGPDGVSLSEDMAILNTYVPYDYGYINPTYGWEFV